MTTNTLFGNRVRKSDSASEHKLTDCESNLKNSRHAFLESLPFRFGLEFDAKVIRDFEEHANNSDFECEHELTVDFGI